MSRSIEAEYPVIYLVGTLHTPGKNYTADTLSRVLQLLDPEVVFYEWQVDREIPSLDYPNQSLEDAAIFDFQRKHVFKLVPYDIEGRNEFIRNHGLLSGVSEFFQAIEANLQKEAFTKQDSQELTNLLQRKELFDKISAEESFFVVNSKLYDSISSQIVDQFSDLSIVLCSKYDFLRRYENIMQMNKTYWEKRNLAMSKHILDYVFQKQPKRSVVLCGATHRKYLIDLIGRDEKIDLQSDYTECMSFFRLQE